MDIQPSEQCFYLIVADGFRQHLVHAVIEALLLDGLVTLRVGSQRHDVRHFNVLFLADLQDLLGALEPVHLRHVAIHKDALVRWVN